mgnify:FL=1
MSVQETINKIISRRNTEALELKAEKAAAERRIAALQELKNKCAAAAAQEDYRQMLEANSGLEEKIKDMAKMDSCIAAFQDAAGEIERLISRFERKTINVSAVGDSRSGKSRFMQTVSGLDNDCIPSFEGSFCTGVRSIIQNKDVEMPEAVITLKTEQDVINEINEKLEYMTAGKMNILSLDELTAAFGESLVSAVRNDEEKDMARGRVADFINMYIGGDQGEESVKEWKELIKINGTDADLPVLEKYKLTVRDPEKREFVCRDKSEIRKFVAKRDSGTEDKNGTDALPFYRYIAVQGAVIYARFVLTEMTQLRLVDTVGLGDLAEGTTEKMHKVIGGESDAVIYFFCPAPGKGGQINDRIYRILNRDIIPRYEKQAMKKWMAVVVNHKKMDKWDNTNECPKFLEYLDNNVPSMGPDRMDNVVFSKVIDVSDPEAVGRDCLEPLLSSLLNNLEEVDRVFRSAADEKLKAAKQKLKELSGGFEELNIPEADDIIKLNFDEMFESFITKVREFSGEISSQPGLENKLFDRSLKAVEGLISTGQDNLSGEGTETVTTEAICGSIGKCTKAESVKLLALDELQRTVRGIGKNSSGDLREKEREMKEKLADLFLQEFHFERSEVTQHTDPDFFRKMAGELFGKDKDCDPMRDAFLSMGQFSLNEADGIVKLIFNDCADRYIAANERESEKSGEEKESEDEKSSAAPTQIFVNMSGKKESREPEDAAEAEERESVPEKTLLIHDMDERVRKFIEGVRKSELYKLKSAVPLSSQVKEELRYFLNCFDLGYHRQWADVLNGQMKKGHVFVKEKREIDNKKYLYQQFARALKNCFPK